MLRPDPSFFKPRIRKRYPNPDPNNFFSECMCPDSKRTDITSSDTAQKVEMSFKNNFAAPPPASVVAAPNPLPASLNSAWISLVYIVSVLWKWIDLLGHSGVRWFITKGCEYSFLQQFCCEFDLFMAFVYIRWTIYYAKNCGKWEVQLHWCATLIEKPSW